MSSSSQATSLSEFEVSVIDATEQVFWETGYAPTPERLAEMLHAPLAQVKKALAKPLARQAIAGRGVDLLNDHSKQLLTTEQLMTVNLLLNAHDVRSTREKLASINVSTQKFAAWQRTPQFQQYFRKRVEEMFPSADSQAYLALIRNVEQGDTQSIKLFLELRGLYTPTTKVRQEFDPIDLLNQVVDILQRHLSEHPDLLFKIATSLENLVRAPLTLSPTEIVSTPSLPAETLPLLSSDTDLPDVLLTTNAFDNSLLGLSDDTPSL